MNTTNTTITTIDAFNLTDTQWEAGLDGVYLGADGWYVRHQGQESGPWDDRQFVEEAAPEFFQ